MLFQYLVVYVVQVEFIALLLLFVHVHPAILLYSISSPIAMNQFYLGRNVNAQVKGYRS